MPGAPLSLPEREEISVALIEDRGTPWAVLGRRVGRHPTTIMREVTTNGGRARYRPAVAERRAEKERCRPRQHRLALAGAPGDRVTADLRLGRSPEAIWADLVAECVTERVCVETIYAAVYAGVLGVKPTECLCGRDGLEGGAAKPDTRPTALVFPTSPPGLRRSTTGSSSATGRAIRSSGSPTAPRCCGSPSG